MKTESALHASYLVGALARAHKHADRSMESFPSSLSSMVKSDILDALRASREAADEAHEFACKALRLLEEAEKLPPKVES